MNNISIYNTGSTTTSLILSSPGLTSDDKYNNSSVYFTFGGTSYVRKVTDSTWDSGNSRMTLVVTPTLGSITLTGTLTANIAPYLQIIGDGHGQELVLTSNSLAANSVGANVTRCCIENIFGSATGSMSILSSKSVCLISRSPPTTSYG